MSKRAKIEWADRTASVQAFGTVKTVTNAGAVPRRGSDVGTSPLLGMDSVAE